MHHFVHVLQKIGSVFALVLALVLALTLPGSSRVVGALEGGLHGETA